MRIVVAAIAISAFCVSIGAQAQVVSHGQAPAINPLTGTPNLKRDVDQVIAGLWNRPQLNPRDRSLVTVAALVTQGTTNDMPEHFNLALDNGVTPTELSGAVSHLAFYAGLPRATAAERVLVDVYQRRGIAAASLPTTPASLSEDPAVRKAREAAVNRALRGIAPGFADYTDGFLNRELWLRNDLRPRDRSLVTVASLITANHQAQLSAHAAKGRSNGLTRVELGEVATHLAFYAGWPPAYSAASIVEQVFDDQSVPTERAPAIRN